MTDPFSPGELVTSKFGETYLLRAAKADDEDLVRSLLEHESADDIRYRFFVSLRHFDHDFLCKLLSVDDARAVSLIAIIPNDGSAAGLACLHRIGNEPACGVCNTGAFRPERPWRRLGG